MYAQAWDEDLTPEQLRELVRDHASSVSHFAEEVKSAGGVNAQANMLLHRVQVNKASHVFTQPAGRGLPDDYVCVIEANPPGEHAFVCGIDPDGRSSS